MHALISPEIVHAGTVKGLREPLMACPRERERASERERERESQGHKWILNSYFDLHCDAMQVPWTKTVITVRGVAVVVSRK